MPEPYQDRVVNEYYELSERNKKLLDFITGDVFPNLDPIERNLLVEQQGAMANYRFYLHERIKRWGIELRPITA